jgi:gluconate 2-dehydrogenase alpha chain
MAIKMKPVDVVLVGVGWTGAILAKELTQAGLKVVGLERGRMRNTVPDFQSPGMHDELKYAVRYDLMQDTASETVTFRNNTDQEALPMRQLDSFLPGTDVGGAGVHWNGQTWRFLPSDFRMRSHHEERYGKNFIQPDLTIQDWGVTYEELEPHYDRFEYLCGIGGKAGNLDGKIQPGGNPFEGPRSREYPNPPMKTAYAGALFTKAAQELGYSPFPVPSANMSQAYKNPEGMEMNGCAYCGFCERFGCEHFAKASPQTTILPIALKNPNFELRTQSHVTKVLTSRDGKHATGVLYVDARGREVEQPAEMVFLCAWAFHNVRLMLLSGIGKPYDPKSGEGVIGRNYSYQTMSGATIFFEDKKMNNFMGAGALGMVIDDFNGDNFDHGPLGFVGGAYIAAYSTGARPIQYHPVPPGTPRWGREWKEAVAKYYTRSTSLQCHGSSMSSRGNYVDLDPTYKDAFGQPLMRITFDFPKNDVMMADYLADRAEEIALRMGGSIVQKNRRSTPYTVTTYQTTHNCGGAIMGTDSRTSAVNRYLQAWDIPNLFVMGTATYPQNAGYNPTDTVGALTYWALDAIKGQYLKNPGHPMVRT